MAITFFSGFETGTQAIDTNGLSGTSSIVTSPVHGGTYALRINPTTTGAGDALFSWLDSAGKMLGTGSPPVSIVSFMFRYATKPAANNEEICRISSGVFVQVRLGSDGKLSLYNDNTLNASGTVVLAADTWYRIDVKVDDSANTQEVRVNGTVDISGTIATSSGLLSCALGKQTNRNGQTVDFFYDDFCFADNAYPTSGIVLLALPIGAGSAAGWTNGTGTTFAEVDETPAAGNDGDTTYIQASATQDNQDHTLDFQNVATIGITTTIRAVQGTVYAKTTSTSGSSSVSARMVVGADAVELSGSELGTSYVGIHHCRVLQPDNTTSWDTTSFDAVEFGMAANAIAQVQRFTVAYVQAWVDVPATQSQAPRTMHQHMMRRAA